MSHMYQESMEYEVNESVSHSQIEESMEWCESNTNSVKVEQKEEDSQGDERNQEECEEKSQEGKKKLEESKEEPSDNQRPDTHDSGSIQKKKRKVIQTTLSSAGNFLKIRTTLPDQIESRKIARNMKSTNKKMKGKSRNSKFNLTKLDKFGQTDQSDRPDQSHRCGKTIDQFFRPVPN